MTRRLLALLTVLSLMAIVSACAKSVNSAGSTTTTGASTGTTTPAGVTVGGSWTAKNVSLSADSLQCAGNKPADEHRGITATSIKIGGLGTVTGPTTALWGDADKAARARFDAINAAGGINGRKIDYVGMSDDGLDPTRSVTEAQKLAEQTKVFAVAPLLTGLSSYADTFCHDVVPYVGWGFNTGFCGNTVGFGFDGCLVTGNSKFTANNSSPLATILGNSSDKSVALIGNDDDPAKKGNAELASADKAVGLKVVYNENNLPDNAPLADPSPVVNSIMTSNAGQPPAAVYLVADFSNTQTIVSGLVAAGYKGAIVDAVGYDPRLASYKPFDGTYTTLLWAPFESTNVPFVQQMTADLDKYAPGLNHGLQAAAGYISADFLIAALEAAGPNLTVSGFLDALNNDHYTYSRSNFIGATHWPLNHIVGAPCGTMVQLKNKVYRQTQPLACTGITEHK